MAVSGIGGPAVGPTFLNRGWVSVFATCGGILVKHRMVLARRTVCGLDDRHPNLCWAPGCPNSPTGVAIRWSQGLLNGIDSSPVVRAGFLISDSNCFWFVSDVARSAQFLQIWPALFARYSLPRVVPCRWFL